MRKLSFLLFAVATMMTSVVSATDSFKVDTKATKIKWLGEKVTGEHYGFINVSKGEVTLESGRLSSVMITMDMNSITCTDIEDKEYNEKLVGHLKADDFFGVDNHATSTFKSTKIVVIDGKAGKYKVTGDMTIKGISKPQTFEVTIGTNGDKLNAKAEIKIDRTAYDIKYGSSSFFDSLGDKAIYDEFTLTVELHGLKG
jgi:polyisoprenoid-binding protein YceI